MRKKSKVSVEGISDFLKEHHKKLSSTLLKRQVAVDIVNLITGEKY